MLKIQKSVIGLTDTLQMISIWAESCSGVLGSVGGREPREKRRRLLKARKGPRGGRICEFSSTV